MALILARKVEELAEEYSAKAVSKIVLKIGPFSCLDMDSLRFAFDVVKGESELLKRACLESVEGEGDEVIIEKVEMDV